MKYIMSCMMLSMLAQWLDEVGRKQLRKRVYCCVHTLTFSDAIFCVFCAFCFTHTHTHTHTHIYTYGTNKSKMYNILSLHTKEIASI
jgi:hypothetical protein